MTLIYIATHSRKDLYQEVSQSLRAGQITPALFETYLATIRHLQPSFIRAYQEKATTSSNKLERKLPSSYITSIINDKDLPAAIRAAAFPYLENPMAHLPLLVDLMNTSAAPLQEALLQTFRQINDENAAEAILAIALDPQTSTDLRTQALVFLAYQSTAFCEEVSAILQEDDEILLEPAIRYLCRCSNDASVQATVDHHAEKEEILALWQLCNGQPQESRPQTDEQWEQVVDGNGNARKGKLVFQSPNAQCQSCHQVDGWGGDFGPDLSNIGRSKTQEQLITALLEPSAEISPEWQGWFVTTQEGQTYYGRQINVGFDDVEIMLPTGEFVTYDEPKNYGVAPASLMPEGLENLLTEAEFNDLIAYLMSLK
jgi:hypothetical protein